MATTDPTTSGAASKKTEGGPSAAADVDITFTIAALPRFSLTVRGAVQELEKYSKGDVNTLLPAPAPGELVVKLCKYGRKEHIYRLRLPEDDVAAADAIKEMTAVDRWDIWEKRDSPNTLVATFKGLYLPPPIAPVVLEAGSPTPPIVSADTMAAALQPLAVDRVLRWAIRAPMDAARIALASRLWAAGVREWMLTPRT